MVRSRQPRQSGLRQGGVQRSRLALARDVKAQLPDWTIIYFDDAAADGNPPGALRESFEYEVGS